MVPDISILHRGRTDRLILADAKYQLDADGISPPQHAIDALHVYRDGIGVNGPDGFQTMVDLAIAAYPGPPPADFEQHRYFQSLVDGIGAVPALPSVGGSAALADACGFAG